MREFAYSLFLLTLILTTTVSAQRAGSTRRPQPQPTPAPVLSVEKPDENATQNSLTQQIEALSRQIESRMSNNQKRTIAVVEFVDLNGRVTNFGKFLAEELITQLYQTGKFKVIERQLLNKVIAEQKLSLTGAVDQSTAQKLGKVLGVDAIVSGTITDLNKNLRVNARLINTETGEIFAVASATVVKDETVINLMSDSSTTPVNKTAERPSQSNNAEPSSARRNPTRKVNSSFFTFELIQCRISGTTVICDLIITNNDEDRQVGFGSITKIYDDSGGEFSASRVRVANNEGGSVYTMFISGVSVRARFYFENVSPQTKIISLFDIYCALNGRGQNFNVQFRSVPLYGPLGEAQPSPTSQPDNISDDTESTAQAESVEKSNLQVERTGEKTFNLYPNTQWLDTGIEVEPGMHIEVAASGTITTSGESVSSAITRSILTSILNGRNSRAPSQPVRRNIGPDALIAKIRYSKGGYSNTLVVGTKNTLIVESGEYGRLILGIDQKYINNSSGYFKVNVRW